MASSSHRRGSSLKAISYENVTDGVPPRRVASSINFQDAGSPQLQPRTSQLSYEVKRDSGIAPSISTTGGISYAESGTSCNTTTTAPSVPRTLPTIVIQDERPGNHPQRSESPLAGKGLGRKQDALKSASTPTVNRMSSFKGIETSIPSSSLDDFNLEDLATDKVAFSKRGSLLFGGRKMSRPNSMATITRTSKEEPNSNEAATPGKQSSRKSHSPKQASVSQMEKPSVTTMQSTATHSGRVLSTDEVKYSQRVRSMYEHGDEQAANWAHSPDPVDIERATPESVARDSSTPEFDAAAGALSVNKVRSSDNNNEQSELQTPANNVRLSYYTKQATELAGGIEDWEDVDGEDVDRYGFINPKRITSHDHNSSLHPPAGDGIHRVATSLRLEGDQRRRSRRLTRAFSNRRTSRSVLPRPASQISTVQNGPASMHSTTPSARTSRSYVFRSKNKRAVAEAADMLTLPPGLADIAEHEDGGRTASMLKQREWAREEKWQKMARPIRDRTHSRGGGMRFDFDLQDRKLINRTWKGIPDRWRATAWHSFLSASAKKRKSPATDEELIGQFHKLQEISSADDVQIDVDVPRTISMHIMFRRRYRGGQRLLFRVLHAISLYFPDTGYVQGMASLAATLLCYFDEERAFVMLVRLWQLRGLEQLFQAGFDGLMAALDEFEQQWLGGGEVATKLNELGITSTAYGTRWYLTLFNMSLPFPAQLRVWDVFMLLGDGPTSSSSTFGGADLDVLHATSAAIVDATREIVLDSDFENAMKVLTSFVPIKDEDLLMRVARAEWNLRKKKAASAK